MGIGQQLLFFLAALGVFNGLLLSFYFFFIAKPKRWVNILFGLLLFMLCMRIGKSVLHVFTDLDKIYRQIGLSACMMIGPILLLYIQRFRSKAKAPLTSDWVQLLVPLSSIIIVGIIWPYENYPDIWNKKVVAGIYATWALYMVVATVILFPLLKKAVKKQVVFSEFWVLLVYSCVLLLCIAYISAYNGFPYLAGPLLFSLVLYVLIAILANQKKRSIIMQEGTIKYQNQKISDEKANDLLNRLADMMQSEQFYLNQKIKLPQLAKALDSTPHELSQVINNRLGISFNKYINEFRIKAACQLLKESDHLTIEGIGQEVGFSSKSSFYTAFKALMKQTPAQYKSEVRQSSP